LFIRDALRFISAFIVPISESAPQIYLSALPFAPEHSLVAERFCPRFPNTLTISDGRPSQWPMTAFVAEHFWNHIWCIVLSPDQKTFASISQSANICDSETGHCISGPFKLRNMGTTISGPFSMGTTISSLDEIDVHFSPDGKHILVKYRERNALSCPAMVWNIEKGEEVFQIEGFDFAFVHCGHNEGRIVSMDWTDEDGSSIRTVTQGVQRPTRILVKLWDIGNGIYDRLFQVTGFGVARFSPNGKYLAVERQSESVVELWGLEDGKITHRFLHPPGDLSSLHFSPTSDCLMAAFWMSYHKCLWRLDTQQMMSFDHGAGWASPAVIHLPHTNRVFVPRDKTVEIWEVSATSSNKIFETGPPTTSLISSICPSRDGHRLFIGSTDGTVRMLNLEDLADNQPITQDDTDKPRIIAFSPSGKMVATKSRQSTYIELRDTATWELVEHKDFRYESKIEVAFSADDNRIAVLSGSLLTVYDMNLLENRLTFEPWPKGRRVWNRKAAFQTCNDLVICAQLDDDPQGVSLQVWRVKDHGKCIFSLDIDIDIPLNIFLAPDGLTVIISSPTSCYSWNHDTAQFDHIHFADEAHLVGYRPAYSPDGKLFGCYSFLEKHVRVWDTRTGQPWGKPIAASDVQEIALSPALNDPSLGDRLIALRWDGTDTIALFDVHTSHLYARFWDPGWYMAFIRDVTKLASYHYHDSSDNDTTRIYDIADLAAKHRNATHGYEPVPRYTRNGWMMGQENELLFWVPLEHRKVLCLPRVEPIWERPVKVDLSNLKFGTKWTECIDKEWLKGLEERGKRAGKILE